MKRLFSKSTNELVFTNESYRALPVNYDNFFGNAENAINLDRPLLSQIRRVSFEISNICNYSAYHRKCPASKQITKKVLPSRIVRKVLEELSCVNYDGVVAFHRYNEPLIDPRLFAFIRLSHELCPKSKVLVLSNGFYLTGELAVDLAELNVWALVVSAYSAGEFERLSSICVGIPYKVFYSTLDDREDIYDRSPLDLDRGCLAPLRDLTINAEGKIVLCCLDWKDKHEFGDLGRSRLVEIVNGPEFLTITRELYAKKRRLDICRRCAMSR